MTEPGYFSSIKNSLCALYNSSDLLSIDRIKYEIKLFEGNITITDLFAIIFWMVVLIESRTLCRKLIMTLCLSAGCEPKRREKICECFWKAFIHTILTVLAAYTVFKHNCEICFTDVTPGYKNYSPKVMLSLDNKLLIYLLISYYSYGLYSIVFIDIRKKDTGLLIFHHCVALCMFFLSLYSRLHGAVAMTSLLHDSNDIVLEVGKFLFHFRYQNGEINPLIAKLTHICGRLLPISWFITRIYYYPLKCLYGISIFNMNLAIWLICVCAWIVMAMNVFWFIWIVSNHLALLTGRVTELSDISSIEVRKKN